MKSPDGRVELKINYEPFLGAFWCAEETVALLKSEVKSQERHVKTLKRKSLWAKVLEEVTIKYFLAATC